MSPTVVIPPLSEDYSDIIIRNASDSSDLNSGLSLSGAPDLPESMLCAKSFQHTNVSVQTDSPDYADSVPYTNVPAQMDSPDYTDFVPHTDVPVQTDPQSAAGFCAQIVDNQYTILYAPLSRHLSTVEEIGYASVPKLFTEINVVSLEAAGILPVRIRSSIELSGAGVLVGFLDSGIDYTHPAFRNPDGSTRVLRLWDQADTRGAPPEGISYGTEYTQDDINQALFSGALPGFASADSRPAESAPIPYLDPRGHGTAAAGIACGSPDAGEGFTGVAPESAIAFVRLKPAKQYLRNYFRIPEEAAAYQENDLMLGIRYLVDCASQLSMPLVICMSLGSSQGGHTGNTPLEEVLDAAVYAGNTCAVTGTGNEAGLGHHFARQLRFASDAIDAELLIEQETDGVSVEFWADAPDLYSVGFTSPSGEIISPVHPDYGVSREFSFLLERSRISVTWSAEGPPDGSQVILMRFQDPAPGIWRIRIESLGIPTGPFHLWLPISGLIPPGIRFLAPNEDTTLVIPSCAFFPLAVGTWNAYTGSLYPYSGRGYTRSGRIRPDLVSPGVRVTCPASSGGYSSMTGSCAASALTAGAAALLLEGALRQTPSRPFSGTEMKELLLRGARQDAGITYPNPSWGYGILNVFDSLTKVNPPF